jgi:glutathione S-transferase
MTPIRFYRFGLSGHSHRVELFLSLLGLPVETVEVDLSQGAHKRPDYLALNPFGQVPVIQDGDLTIADSNAILVYLAMRYDPAGQWLPKDPGRAAEVQRWLSVAAGQVAHGSAAARRAAVFGAKLDIDEAKATAERLHGLLDRHLSGRDFLLGPMPTIADVALYTYTAKAPEGGLSLESYPNLVGWLARIEHLPGFVAMPDARTARAA